MPKPTITIEDTGDYGGITECDYERKGSCYSQRWMLQAYSAEEAHIGDAWTCTGHIRHGYDELIEKAKAYA